jgi:membrane protein DedA with SNARE-associated domain
MLELIDEFGYLGVGAVVFVESFGIPAPGETAIIAGAVAAASGHLNILAVAATAFLAAVIGDTLGYEIGRRGGRPLVNRFGRYVRLTPARLEKLEGFMTRQGPKVIVVARFVEGLRQFNGIVAGLAGLHYRKFLAWNALGAALWVGLWATAAYLAGDHIEEIAKATSRYLVVAVVVAGMVVIAYFWRRRYRHQSAAR